ncbi:MAG: Asp-tRNA(Asn) amidotransferase subunit GatC [Methanobacteriaceae archaeon]|nr:Asp-tRNA(Asn) amidotransferase subunit GatC [Methanobacteriaceae archaeon]
MTEIEKDAEEILEKFSKTLDTIPDLEETYYITDNLNLNREDKSNPQDATKIVRNTKTDKDGNVIVKKADWI